MTTQNFLHGEGKALYMLTEEQLNQFAHSVAEQTLEMLESKERAKSDEQAIGLMTAKEVMARYKVSAPTLWRWGKAKLLVPTKIGRNNMYREEDVKRAIGL